jgi:hypothetical protein
VKIPHVISQEKKLFYVRFMNLKCAASKTHRAHVLNIRNTNLMLLIKKNNVYIHHWLLWLRVDQLFRIVRVAVRGDYRPDSPLGLTINC